MMNHLLSILLFVIVLSPSESQNNLGFFGLSDLPEPPKPGGGSVPYPGQFWDLVEVASASGKFKTLIKIIKDLGLVQPLREVEAATIFAPTDAAFAKLPKGLLKRLTTAQKRAIISRHVIGGQRILARDIKSVPVETLGGEVVNLFKTQRGGVSIIYDGNASKVV